MRRLPFLLLGLVLLSVPAWAQNAVPQAYQNNGHTSTIPVTPANPLPVTGTGGGGAVIVTPVPSATATSNGLALTTGGTPQTISTTCATCLGRVLQNPYLATDEGISVAEPVYVALGSATPAAAGTTNYCVMPPGGSCTVTFNGVAYTGLVKIVAATTGHIIYEVDLKP